MPQHALALTAHPDKDWEKFCESMTEASYESLDNLLDDIGLHGTVDIVAGAFYSRKEHTIHAKQGIIDAAKIGKRSAVLLLEHEYCHAMRKPLHDHPTTIKAGIRHAWMVRFDARAYTRLLRWRRSAWRSSFDHWMSSLET